MTRRTIRVADDNGETRAAWTVIGVLPLNAEDRDGLHLLDGPTGGPRGRPRKGYDDLSRTGKIMRAQADVRALLANEEAELEVGCSGPDDWARERREREEALERVNKTAKRGRASG